MSVVYILGGTGTGKTSLSIRLATLLQAEIINADAMQTYTGFDIGTAKITPQEMSGIPHHGFDLIDPVQSPECMSLHRYLAFAVPLITKLVESGKNVVIVGGSNMYLNNLIWSSDSSGSLNVLIHPNDERRLQNVSRFGQGQNSKLRFPTSRFIVLELGQGATEWMRLRLEARVDKMFQAGLVAEAEKARTVFPPGKGVLQAIGYREFLDPAGTGKTGINDPEYSLEVKGEIKKNTWNYFRKQEKWLRNSLIPKFPIEPVRVVVGPETMTDLDGLVCMIMSPKDKEVLTKKEKRMLVCEKCNLSFPGTEEDWQFHFKSKRHRK